MRYTLLLLLVVIPPIAPQLSADDWKSFSPKDGAFSVLFPGKPTEFRQSIKTAIGPAEALLYEVAVPPGDRKFMVSYSEYEQASIKPGTEDKRLNNARDGLIASVKGKLKREKSLLLDNYPGRELYIEVEGKANVLIRLYAVKNRLYEAVAAGGADFVTSKDAAKFLESFKLGK
jgi:hypothetical protein